MKCWKCNNELLEEAVFCSFCGVKQPMKVEQTIQSRPAAYMTANQPAPNATMKPVVRKKRKKNTAAIAIVLAVVVAAGVLGAAGGGAYLYFSRISDDTYEEEYLPEEEIVTEEPPVENPGSDWMVEHSLEAEAETEDSTDLFEMRRLYIPTIEQYAEIMTAPSADEFYNIETEGSQVAYTFADIDGNGIEECILKYDNYVFLSTEDMTGDHRDATCIFTLENGEVVKVLGEMAQPPAGVTGCVKIFQGTNWIMKAYDHLGIPTTFHKYENGKITEELSLYVIDENSSSDYMTHYMFNDREISQVEYFNRWNSLVKGGLGYDLTLYDGTVKIGDEENTVAEKSYEIDPNAAGTPIDITSPEGQTIATFISDFDGYLGFVLDSNSEFYYEDDASKNCMLLYGHDWFNGDYSLANITSALTTLVHRYFTSGEFCLKEDNGLMRISDITEIFSVRDQEVVYKGGDWGGSYPIGQIREIKLVDSDYIVTYDVACENINTKEIVYMMGTYTIVLRKDGESFKFHYIEN